MNFQKNLLAILIAGGMSMFFPANAQRIIKAQKVNMSTDEIDFIRQKEGVFQPGKNYNVLIHGYGTGLRPLSEAQLDALLEEPILIESYDGDAAPVSHDNSSLPWFPPIGNQASEGSCVAWATGYYTKTFQEAREHSWDLSGASWTSGEPTVTYQDNIFSPDFIYHQINDGVDGGATYFDAMYLMENVGCCTWLNMPYSYVDHTSWPNIAAWREAPLYRSATAYSMMYVQTDPEIETLKQMLADENLAIISMNAYQYDNLSTEDFWTSDDYVAVSTNHANTIVGYDDGYGPYIEEGEVRYGAFKVANSWGEGGWENVADGFYYMSYECLKQDIEYVMFYENLVGYNPTMLAVYNIDHANRDDCRISFGIGDVGSPFEEKYLNEGQYYRGGNHPFPSNDLALDISEFQPYFTGTSDIIFEDVYDLGSIGGQLNSFSVELYSDYESGVPTEIFSAPDLPISTQYLTDVYAIINCQNVYPDISVSPSSLEETLEPEGTSTQTWSIGNLGDGILHWDLSITYLDGLDRQYNPEDLNPALIPGPEGSRGDPITAGVQSERILAPDVDQPLIEKEGANPVSVLYINTNAGLDPIFIGQVSALPNVSTLDVVDGQVETPNTDYLLMYDVVMVASDYGFLDSWYLGNNLASYSDQGGAIITLNGTTCTGGNWALAGDITGPDYLPFALTDYTSSPNTCTDFISHPITENVSTISTSIYANAVLQGAGVSLGSYGTGGPPVGAYNPARPIVSLNVFPLDGNWEGDLIQMIYNTINWFGGGSGWLSCTPVAGSIPAGGSTVIDANFDAIGLAEGEYHANINIFSNDPDETLVVLPVTLTVIGGCDPGWTVVYYTNSTTAYGIVTLDGTTPASPGDLVGVFVGEECRGISEVIIDGGTAYVTLLIQGEVVERAEFRIWDASECTVIPEAYCADTDPGGILGYPPDYLPIGSGEGCTSEQMLHHNTGWNLISLYVHPDDMSPENIFGEFSCLLQVKDVTQSYDPFLHPYLNTLVELTDGMGYFTNSSCTEEHLIVGQLVDGPATPIDLSAGWNLIGYPFETPNPPEVAFASLIGAGNLVQVKSMTESYDPLLPPYLNTLTTLEPGKGYFINVNAAVTFYYPAPAGTAMKSAESGRIEFPWSTTMYTQSMVQYGHVTLDGSPVEGEAVVGAFVNNECRGQAAVVESGGETYTTLVVHGEEAENVSYKLFLEGNTYTSNTVTVNNPGGITQAVTDIQFYSSLLDEIDLRVYPNPANDYVIIAYELNMDSKVNVTILDMLGKVVYTYEEMNQAGSHLLTVEDMKTKLNMHEGTYILRFSNLEYTATKKIMIQ